MLSVWNRPLSTILQESWPSLGQRTARDKSWLTQKPAYRCSSRELRKSPTVENAKIADVEKCASRRRRWKVKSGGEPSLHFLQPHNLSGPLVLYLLHSSNIPCNHLPFCWLIDIVLPYSRITMSSSSFKAEGSHANLLSDSKSCRLFRCFDRSGDFVELQIMMGPCLFSTSLTV